MSNSKHPLNAAEADLHSAAEALATFVRQAAQRLLEQCPQAKGWMCDVLPLNDSDSHTEADTLPFLSIRAFRALEIRQIAAQDVIARFYSSGSTSGTASSRGMHCLGQAGSEAYAAAALRGYLGFIERLSLSAASTTLVTMIPRLTEWKNSSLAAMFELLASSGIHVIWSSPESIIADLSEQAKEHQTRNLIIFGTSLHHHIVHAARADRAAGSDTKSEAENQDSTAWFDVVSAVDTGGAKGKTVVLDPSEMGKLLRETYSFIPCKKLVNASQYGMCELTSQAWSNSNLLREFVAAPSLIPVVIDPQTMRLAPPGRAGLLAFIDCANVDSYPAIITEDLGIMMASSENDKATLSPGKTFQLLGRAPMASIKGCSLRVQDLPVSLEPQREKNGAPIGQAPSPGFMAAQPVANQTIESTWLPVDSAEMPDCFTPREKELLRRAIESCPKIRDFSRNRTDHHSSSAALEKNLIIIASANVSVTFLFPIVAALENGFTQVDLVLPSMRDDDPLALTVSEQVAWILNGLDRSMADYGMRINPLNQLPASIAIKSYHTMIVFGSNETVALFKSRYGDSPTRILGFGDIHNTIHLQTEYTQTEHSSVTPEHVAASCLNWRGRGCLTPRLIVTGETKTSEDSLRSFCEAFHTLFSHEFSCIEPDLLALFHWHSTIEVKALFGSQVAIHRRLGSTIADLRNVPCDVLSKSLNLSLAGQGFIFLITESQFSILNHSGSHAFETVSVEPEFRDPHQGKSWSTWLRESLERSKD
jgi:hypothetical protein